MNSNNLDNLLEDKTILITGGTGSFGKACTKELLTQYKPEAIRIYSRDELKQWEMKNEFSQFPNSDILRFFIGDVRDANRLERAMKGADFVIHAAALKQVPACEYNPTEAIKTNILGGMNVIDAALNCSVEKVVALSTDKASCPINLYGATKLCSDKLFMQANNYRGSKNTAFSVVRYGNVMASRGSVIPLFKEQAKTGTLTITDEKMTRFWITLEQAVNFVLTSFPIMQGGELFVPKIPSMKITDLAKCIAPDAKFIVTGLRPGEKLHESLISPDEAVNTFDIGDRYFIQPMMMERWVSDWDKYPQVIKVPDDFEYNSEDNPDYLTSEQMQELLHRFTHEDKSSKIPEVAQIKS
ncbi:MAG: hypothetical protein US86_C0001G0139 [Candidatus Daviesbacteria bacterium GW2011_GWA2_38_24]|uniref:Polysaccharide biosynthesis protein CapD-like domain-containing protein n=1 Tax=Candidatus Daviesbacteria bacterium GW2011_GWA2_38_24 TaxID=1618422 RepID=A0A0G0JK54_9BACT|nr:MAG: hypothetical protein US86_C0001G0139 [Candidatus Daviesbacteria bacterium GW2011_GWA2_38_24]